MAPARFGQHFLADSSAISKIVSYLQVKKEDRVFEIGPGRGALTRALLEKAGEVTAVEVDRKMVEILTPLFGNQSHFHLKAEDILKFDLGSLPPGPSWLVAGNLPYNLTSPILRRLSDWAGWTRACVMVQKEVGDRLCAKVGTGEYGAITVGMTLTCEMERVFDLPPGAFRPPPKVHSTVVGLTRRPEPLTAKWKITQRIIQAAFQQRRKTILNSLSHGLGVPKDKVELILNKLELDPVLRAERISPEDFVRLTAEFEPHLS